MRTGSAQKSRSDESRVNKTDAWESVVRRDHEADDRFLYAVSTTRIYCRPSCPSRRPKREHVTFFSSSTAAELAGYRACQRCRPDRPKPGPTAIQRARTYIDNQFAAASEERITLQRLAEISGLSPYHLQRKFKQAVGLTPAQYVRSLKSDRLKANLRRGETVSRATFGAGYGSSSRVYDDAPSRLGMTPAAYRRGGSGAHIEYVIATTSLGNLLVAATSRGICAVSLGDTVEALEDILSREFPAATRIFAASSPSSLCSWVKKVVSAVDGERTKLDLPIDAQATSFQWAVWRELQKIPMGETRSYSEIAAAIGSPKAVRAVGSACAKNPVAVVIPCHRAVRKTGALGGYRWGLERKQRLLAKERGVTDD
jgi:AraC family transcriptional regulator of adaptative response/methylated-DNA-[protein]-cysteine methyltransferase